MSNEVVNARIKEQVSDRYVVFEKFQSDYCIINSVQNEREISDFGNQTVENRWHFHSDAFDSTEAGEPTSEKKKKKKQKNSADKHFGHTQQKVKDKYCWVCHKCGQIISCSSCCRGYHLACLNLSSADTPSGWVCTECKTPSMTECTVYASKLTSITNDQLIRMLLFLIDRLSMQSWAKHFREPLDESIASGYYTMVVHSVNLRDLRSDVLDGWYSSIQSFVNEFRWILHNSIIFNGLNSPVTTQARLLDTGCSRETAFMRSCPSCYLVRIPALSLLPSTSKTLPLLDVDLPPIPSSKSSVSPRGVASRNAVSTEPILAASSGAGTVTKPSGADFDPWWFCFVCDVAHPIVWVRLKHYPRWPAKVIFLEKDISVLVSFFGDYDLTTAPIGSVTLHSESRHASLSLPGNCCQAPVVTAAPTLDPITSPLSSSEHSSAHTDTPPPPPISPGSPNSSLSLMSTVSGSRSRRPSSEKLALFYPNYRQAILELDRYVAGLRERWPQFVLPPSKYTEFTRCNVEKYYGSHLYESADATKTSSSGLAPIASGATPPTSSASSFVQTTVPVDQAVPLLETSANVRCSPRRLDTHSRAISVPGRPDTSNCDHSSRPPSIRTSLSDQGVLVRVAATLRDVRPLCPMPSLQPVPLSESDPAIRPGDEDATAEVAAVTRSFSPPPVVPLLTALEPPASRADTESTRQVIDRYRVQLNEMLVKLADTLSSQDIPHTVSADCSTSTQSKLVDVEVQTSVCDCEVALPSMKRPCSSPPQSESDLQPLPKVPKLVSVSTSPVVEPDQTVAPASSLQVAMMEEEIERLDDEVDRLNVLLNLTRLEMGVETRRRMVELRRVWTAEITAVLDAAIRIWEQDVVKLVDNVKRKQWCAYCGRVAYYYCCWNTCYCDISCQTKHWAMHITSCVQARGHQPQQQSAVVSVAKVATANPSAPMADRFNGIASVPAVIRSATGTSAGLSLGVPIQPQVAVAAATGPDQQARYQQQHVVQQQANWLQHSLPVSVVGGTTVSVTSLPSHNVPRQVDLPQLGSLVK